MSKEDFSEIKELAKQINDLAIVANEQFTVELNTIIAGQIKEPKVIENLLDRMLDFASHDNVLLLYKKLCRYYLPIDPTATASYIYAYRDMWDSESYEDSSAEASEDKEEGD